MSTTVFLRETYPDMAIFIDQIMTHGNSNTGDDTVPPGISGLDWCHMVSTVSLAELTTFLTVNLITVQCPPSNVRIPLLGSNMTYVGLDTNQRDAAIAAGASPQRRQTLVAACFDSPGPGSTYEP